jgi:glycosyltransferase involved in cell wall biosynthesis
MIFIYTRAYNTESTISQTIESVLAQSREDFVYAILDNGSTDSTFAIISCYAESDKRIRVFRNIRNNTGFGSSFGMFTHFACNFSENDYFCNIDGDDLMHPDFLAKCAGLAESANCDVVFSGYNIFAKSTAEFIKKQRVEEDIIIPNLRLAEYFKVYRKFTTDVWAKLFKGGIIKYFCECVYSSRATHMYLNSQQQFIYFALQNSHRLGLLSACPFDFFASNLEQTTQRTSDFLGARLSLPFVIVNIMTNFLEKIDGLNHKNLSYTYAVLLGYIIDIFESIKFSNSISLANKLSHVRNICREERLRFALLYHAEYEYRNLRAEKKSEVFNSLLAYFLAQNWRPYSQTLNAIVDTVIACGVRLESAIFEQLGREESKTPMQLVLFPPAPGDSEDL